MSIRVPLARLLRFGCLAVALACAGATARADASAPTPEQWIEWGSRVHGGFGVLIALGIRMGEDAMVHLGAQRRELEVNYFDSPGSPCPCVIDGIMVAVSASPGQNTLRVGAEPAGKGYFGEALFRHRESGRAVRMCIRNEAMPLLFEYQKNARFRERYDAVMRLKAETLYFASGVAEQCVEPRETPGAQGADAAR